MLDCRVYPWINGRGGNELHQHRLQLSSQSQMEVRYLGRPSFSAPFANKHNAPCRNVGIIFVFIVGLMCVYLGATDTIKGQKSKGEVIVFPRKFAKKRDTEDEEKGFQASKSTQANGNHEAAAIERNTAIFHWQDVCYDVQIKKETRRILDHVDGYIVPGTITALM